MKNTYKQNKQYKYSVIIPAYNVEEYIVECLQSVIYQKCISFEEEVEIIVIDDGSVDYTADRVRKYEERYPYNIKLIQQMNSGVAVARNKGLEYANGKYINFLDADDKLSENVLYEAGLFLEKYQEEIDFVAIPIRYFEAEQGEHTLNYKFKTTRIIDIQKEPTCIQLSVASTVILREHIKNNHFDKGVKYGEDAKFITRLLLNKKCYGVLNSCYYLYRKRRHNDSTIQQSSYDKNWYQMGEDTLVHELYHKIKAKKDRAYDEYLSYLMMYELKWKINVLGKYLEKVEEKEQKEILDQLYKYLEVVSVRSILSQKHLRSYRKIVILLIKVIKLKILRYIL